MAKAKEYNINIPVVRAVVLAAGESIRTGTPKMLLTIGTKTLIEKVIENILASHVKSITVVLGAYREQIGLIISNLPVSHTFNENYRDGMLSSVICGLKSLPEQTDAAIIYPGDYPFIKAGIINEMIDVYRSTGKGIVIPVCKGRRGHPIIIDRKYFNEVEKLDEKRGLRALAEKFRNEIQEYITDNEMIFNDIDTLEDYFKAEQKSK